MELQGNYPDADCFDDFVPALNIRVFERLYLVEVAIRELIIETLSRVKGPAWHKSCLPGSALEKFREGIKYERGIPWTQFVHQHYLYYVDFSHLREIIARKGLWEEAFEPIFGANKGVIEAILTELEPIRNKIAHNRKATNTDLEIVNSHLSQIATFVGSEHLLSLLRHSFSCPDLLAIFATLKREATLAFEACMVLSPIETLNCWEKVSHEWWYDDCYISCDLSPITILFSKFNEYSLLERRRGFGYKIETWVKSNNLPQDFDSAMKVFDHIFKQRF